MSTPEHLLPPPPACPCVVLIGMAGAGKSTVGMALAQTLGWAFMDSDYLMEALYADRLQSVTDALSKEAFLDLEAVVLGSIIYYIVMQVVLWLKLDSDMFKLLSAAIVAVFWPSPIGRASTSGPL